MAALTNSKTPEFLQRHTSAELALLGTRLPMTARLFNEHIVLNSRSIDACRGPSSLVQRWSGLGEHFQPA